MRFRDVLAAVRDVLADPAVQAALPQSKLTAIRDLRGAVRIVVEEAPAGEMRAPALGILESKLVAKLGRWVGALTPVWCSDDSKSVRALMTEIRTQRTKPPGWAPNAYLVERHVAKRGWLLGIPYAPPWPTTEADAGTAPHILTFFSHKGGVGRTTLLASVAIQAARHGHSVLVLDLDLEAPGLGTLFGVVPAEGVVELLLDDDPAVDDVRNAVALVQEQAIIGAGRPIRVLSAGVVDSSYLEALGRLDFQTSTGHGGMLSRLSHLLAAVRDAYPKLDLLLIDARAGFHDLGGMMLGGLTHGAVLVATNSQQAWAGVDAVGRVLAEPWRSGQAAEPVPLVVVHSLAPEPMAPGGGEERAAFRSTLYTRLAEVYYPQDALPAESADDRAHEAVVVPWASALRGQGGPVDGAMADFLAEGAFHDVYERIARSFPRPEQPL